MPQVLPVIAGQILYFIESNTRSATVIGVVGAGGMGLYLSEQIRVLEWRQVSFLILLALVSVAAIDFISGRLRAAAQWEANHSRFPLGVDLILAHGSELAVLPRSVRMTGGE
jgi:Bacterial phosphonate metabolism protein (PhnH)